MAKKLKKNEEIEEMENELVEQEIKEKKKLDVPESKKEEEIQLSKEEIEEFKQFLAEKKKKQEMINANPRIAMKEDAKKRLYDQYKEESKLVTGIFRCYEPQGGSVSFPFKKFPWQKVEHYTFEDGLIYTIPLCVALHLRDNCNSEIHSHAMDANGVPIISKEKKKQRMSFESNTFTPVGV